MFSCSTQLSMKFQILMGTKYQEIKLFQALLSLDAIFLLMYVKMPTNVGILTFMSRKILCSAEMSKIKIITSGQ